MAKLAGVLKRAADAGVASRLAAAEALKASVARHQKVLGCSADAEEGGGGIGGTFSHLGDLFGLPKKGGVAVHLRGGVYMILYICVFSSIQYQASVDTWFVTWFYIPYQESNEGALHKSYFTYGIIWF